MAAGARRRCRRRALARAGTPADAAATHAERISPVSVRDSGRQLAARRRGRSCAGARARGARCSSRFARRARAPRASRLLARRAAGSRSGSLIEWPTRRAGADEVLALERSRDGDARGARPPGQAPLAHRARLPGAEGRARARSLRRARLARASTTTGSYASPPTPSWRPSALGFPPQHLLPSSVPLAYPKVSARAALPVRPERHNPTSITTMRCQPRPLAHRRSAVLPVVRHRRAGSAL